MGSHLTAMRGNNLGMKPTWSMAEQKPGENLGH